MAISRANLPKQMEGKMKTCAACKTQAKCKKAGKCLAKGYKAGKMVRGCGKATKGTRKAKMY
jgi:hypothetical protein